MRFTAAERKWWPPEEARCCSNSVATGRVREVLLDNDANVSDETSLVNENGSTELTIPFKTHLVVKVSNGDSC